MKTFSLLFLALCATLHAKAEPSQREVVAATLILEAGGERNDHGMVAVYEVIQNRARIKKKSLMEICLARKQFSCWNGTTDISKTIERAKKHKKWNEALYVVDNAVDSNCTKGATHYHSNKIAPPYWTKQMTHVATVGNHIFYK